MTKGIGIVFTARNDEVVRAGEEIEESLDDVADSLDNVADTSKDSTDALEDLGDAGDDATTKVADGLQDVEEKSGDVAGTVQGALGDAFSEWDGTAQGAVSSVGGALQGLAGLIPGIGGLIGAGLGVVVSEWAATWDDKSKENAAAVSSMYDDMIASGNKFASQSFVADALKELWDDDGKMQTVLEAADRLGISVATVAEAWVGVPEAMDIVQERADTLADNELFSGDIDSGVVAYFRGIQTELEGVQANTDLASDKATYYEATVAQNAGRWTEVGGEVDAVGNKITNLPQPPPIILRVDDSALEAAVRKQRYANVEVQLTKNGVPVY